MVFIYIIIESNLNNIDNEKFVKRWCDPINANLIPLVIVPIKGYFLLADLKVLDIM